MADLSALMSQWRLEAKEAKEATDRHNLVMQEKADMKIALLMQRIVQQEKEKTEFENMKYMFTHGPHSYTEVLPVTSVVHSKCSVEKVLPRDVLVSQGDGEDSPNYCNIAAGVLIPLLTDSVQPIIEVVDLCA